MFLVFLFEESLNFLCHSHQTNLGVCEILVLGTPLLNGVSDDCPALIYIF